VAGGSVTQAGCPQFWCAFAVRGDTGTYEVYAEDVLRGIWRCSCPAWRFFGRTTCKHIERVYRHGCFDAGPNDLRAVGVEITGESPMITGESPMRATQSTGLRCACGQMMLAPLVRMRDGAGHQIVEVSFGGASWYTYAWAGRVLAVGDVVTVDQNRVTVVALGSDYARELTVIGERSRTRCDIPATTMINSRPSSAPVYTTKIGSVALTVIRVDVRGRISHQLYAADHGTWALVGMFGLYPDALAAVQAWQRYLSTGGTLAAWQAEHPDGVQPNERPTTSGARP
jgi:hypothetical protein